MNIPFVGVLQLDQWQWVYGSVGDLTRASCHNLFPMLSPIYSPIFRPHQCHLTDPSQDFPDLFGLTDRFQSYLTGPIGPHPIALQVTVKTPIGATIHNLREAEACSDHVVITRQLRNHGSPTPP